jgi:acyl dehydratase
VTVRPGTLSEVRGPYFDELTVGDTYAEAPAVTLTEGMQAAHHAITGCRLRISLDRGLARSVAGGPLATPSLVWDISIGQSTAVTQHVRANLYYRGLRFLHQPFLGDTLHTVTTVEALKENRRRPDRDPTGLAVLHIVTTDQDGRTVLDYRRCAMLPLSPGAPPTGHADDVSGQVDVLEDEAVAVSVATWNLDAFVSGARLAGGARPAAGQVLTVVGADVVTSGPELARLTGNVAIVHHDSRAAGGDRLVYGGHTIGIALHQLTRAIPDIVTVVAWHSCDHVGPVRELDTLVSTVEIERVDEIRGSGRLATVRVRTSKLTHDGDLVLDWRLVVLVP